MRYWPWPRWTRTNGAGNNAFWVVTPDGVQPQIAMFEFDTDLSDFTVNPTPVGGVYAPRRDADLDAGVIVHEYGHGVSTRLTGGPSNVTALNTMQSRALGEGWSDYWPLAFFQKAGDRKEDAVNYGDYLNGPNPVLTKGIRRFPYSFDMTINPLTYADYNAGGAPIPNSEEHNAGEIWASVLWDMHWLLTEKYGFSADLYNGQAGNNVAMQLVMDGLKMQPANPSFLDARDAILTADMVRYNGVNQREIWTAFARRGMGYSAIDDTTGTLGSDSEQVQAAFDLPPGSTQLRGTVWRDDNGNGAQETIEPGIAELDGVHRPGPGPGPGSAGATHDDRCQWQLRAGRLCRRRLHGGPGGGVRFLADLPGRVAATHGGDRPGSDR